MHSQQGRGAQIFRRGRMVPPFRQRRLTLFTPPRPIHSPFTPRRTFSGCWRRRPTRTATLLRSAGGSTSRAEPRCACRPRPNDGARFWRCWARGPVPWGMGGGRVNGRARALLKSHGVRRGALESLGPGSGFTPGRGNDLSIYSLTLPMFRCPGNVDAALSSPGRHCWRFIPLATPSYEKSVLWRPGTALAPPTLTHKANGAAR